MILDLAARIIRLAQHAEAAHDEGGRSMKKLINRVDDVLAQALRGFGAAHADLVQVHDAPTFVTRASRPAPARSR